MTIIRQDRKEFHYHRKTKGLKRQFGIVTEYMLEFQKELCENQSDVQIRE